MLGWHKFWIWRGNENKNEANLRSAACKWSAFGLKGESLFFNRELFLNSDVYCKQGVFFHYYETPGSLTRVSTSVPDHIDQEAKKEQCVPGSGTEECAGCQHTSSIHAGSPVHYSHSAVCTWLPDTLPKQRLLFETRRSSNCHKTPKHTCCLQTPTFQHHGQLSSSLTLSAMSLFSFTGQTYPSII